MTTSIHLQQKANELGIYAEIMTCAIEIICQNRNLLNAIDHSGEMDDYIYREILKKAFDKRKTKAENNLYAGDLLIQREAEKDLTMLRREELTSDAFYRAVLPLMVKVLQHQPILRLHAGEASAIVLELADLKQAQNNFPYRNHCKKMCGRNESF